MTRIRILLVLAAAAFPALGCMQTSNTAGSGATNAPAGDQGAASGTREADWSAILKLEDQAKQIAKTTGCSSPSECRSAPVGAKACGGPRYYIPWCAKSTDSAALYSKLEEVANAERAYNKKYEVMSTCEYRVPPQVGLVGGACTER